MWIEEIFGVLENHRVCNFSFGVYVHVGGRSVDGQQMADARDVSQRAIRPTADGSISCLQG